MCSNERSSTHPCLVIVLQGLLVPSLWNPWSAVVHSQPLLFSFILSPTLPADFIHEMDHEQQQPFQPGIGLNQQSGHDMLQPTSASPMTSFMPQEEEINEDNASDPSEDLDKPGKRSAGRRKIKIEYIQEKSKRHITFSKRKAGLMKKVNQQQQRIHGYHHHHRLTTMTTYLGI